MAPAFEYLEVLGEGTSGTVYRARDASGREVAVKLFRPNIAQDPTLFKRFRREAEIATGLRHPNLVATFAGGQTPTGRLFLATELVRGGDLHRLLANGGPLAEPAALRITLDVLDGLRFLHENGLVHRDVKPENILLTEEGVAKLSDFGLAKVMAPEGAPRITGTGEVIGTPYYLAPEQLRGQKDVDARVDLYATGAVLFELIAGRPPFEGASVVDIADAHLRQPVPDLCALRPGVSRGTGALVASLLEKERERRPASTADAEEAAARLLSDAAKAREAVREAVASAAAIAAASASTAGTKGAGPRPSLSSRERVLLRQGLAARLKLVLRGTAGTLTLFAFTGERLQLGRDAIDKSDNDVCLRVSGAGADAGSRKINSRHLKIEVDPLGATIIDLDTRNGTRLDGARLPSGARIGIRPVATISVGGALELEARTLRGENGPAALVLLRPQNRSEHAYALVRERLVIGAREGVLVLGAASGVVLAPGEGGFTLDGTPIAAGAKIEKPGLVIEAAEIRPGDMK